MIYTDGRSLIADSLIELHLFAMEDLGLGRDQYVTTVGRREWERYVLPDVDSTMRVLIDNANVSRIDTHPLRGMRLWNWLWKRMDRRRAKVVLMDPPWEYRNYHDATATRSVLRHYETAPVDALVSYVKPIIDAAAAPDCAFLCWWTNPQLPYFVEFYTKLGLRYKTNGFTWIKLLKRWTDRLPVEPTTESMETLFRMNNGYYTRANSEQCALLEWDWKHDRTKRPFTRPKDKSIRSLVLWPQPDRHSEKPPIHDRIERLAPNCPKLEMFSRRTPPGTMASPWYVCGKEKGKFDGEEASSR